MATLDHVLSICISQRGSNPVSANTQKAECTLYSVRVHGFPCEDLLRADSCNKTRHARGVVAAPDSPLSSVCLADQAGHTEIAAAGFHPFSSTGLGNQKNTHFEISNG